VADAIAQGYPVDALCKELHTNFNEFDRYTFRQKTEVNADTETIFLRYQPLSQMYQYVYNETHDPRVLECVPTDSSDKFPLAMQVAQNFAHSFKADRIGRVMLVRLPPGGHVKTHTDTGYYADYYTRFILPLQADHGNWFRVLEDIVWMPSGDVWTFRYQEEHEAKNESKRDRLTLFVDLHLPEKVEVIPA
jgi:hypothetical protein